jgi:hypothetical protein
MPSGFNANFLPPASDGARMKTKLLFAAFFAAARV